MSKIKNRRILAVVNPVSGLHTSSRTVRDLLAASEKLGVDLEVAFTEKDVEVSTTIREQDGLYDCYLAVGGDGTVLDVAGAAMADNVPLAILPRGTANATAWHFLLPLDAGQALKVAAMGDLLHMDVARTPHRDFLIMAGLGLDAQIIQGATRERKRRLGILAYLYGVAKGGRQKTYAFRVFIDDKRPVLIKGIAAAVANLGTLAGNVRPLKSVSARDGMLDALIISPENFLDASRMAWFGMLGRLNEDPRVKHFCGRRVRIECFPEAPLEMDGDGLGFTRELSAEAVPRGLPIMIPSEGMAVVPWIPDRAKPGLLWGHGARRHRHSPPVPRPKTPIEQDQE